MANGKKLDCVILGLLSHEDLTGYEIKKRMDTALKFFWGASFGSIYPTLKELVEKGLAIKSEADEKDRGKITYSITEKGRQHLKTWLELSAEKDEVRYETLLKLFFADGAGIESAIKHIENFQRKIEREIPFLTKSVNILEGLGNRGAHPYYLATAKFGVKAYTAYLEWCEEAKSILQTGN
jgi:DNA-binding PadR family transcriptional regulator